MEAIFSASAKNYHFGIDFCMFLWLCRSICTALWRGSERRFKGFHFSFWDCDVTCQLLWSMITHVCSPPFCFDRIEKANLRQLWRQESISPSRRILCRESFENIGRWLGTKMGLMKWVGLSLTIDMLLSHSAHLAHIAHLTHLTHDGTARDITDVQMQEDLLVTRFSKLPLRHGIKWPMCPTTY
jgi:hypothetical protein